MFAKRENKRNWDDFYDFLFQFSRTTLIKGGIEKT
jgi:hypothetical protein